MGVKGFCLCAYKTNAGIAQLGERQTEVKLQSWHLKVVRSIRTHRITIFFRLYFCLYSVVVKRLASFILLLRQAVMCRFKPYYNFQPILGPTYSGFFIPSISYVYVSAAMSDQYEEPQRSGFTPNLTYNDAATV